MSGHVAILNVGTGDTKLVFDKTNPQECIRAARIITDMIRRGYALLVEVDRNGVKAFQRIREFREDTCEYIIADFDPVEAAATDEKKEAHEEAAPEEPAQAEAPAKRRGRPRLKDRAIAAGEANAIAIPRRAGG